MNKKWILMATVVMLVAIAIPVAVAALQQSQIIHITKTYTEQPLTSTPTSIATTTPTPTPPSETSTVKYSLWYPNGSAYILHQRNAPSVFGANNLDVNGVPVNVQSGLGAPPMGYVSGVIVVRNDGDVPIIVNATLANVSVPSGVVLTSTCSTIDPSVWGKQVDGWMGRDKLAAGSVLGVGEYAWLSVCVIMTNTTGNMGAVENHEPFSYSFDVAVTVAQV